MKKKLLGLTLAGAILTAGSLQVAASTVIPRNIDDYSTTVGRFNGDGYTDGLKKINTNQNAICNSSSVGGDYNVDVRIERTDGSEPSGWERIGDNDRQSIPNSIGADLYTRLHFSNDATTPVNVQVSGTWSPDTSDKTVN
jgi:hypothetical protein